MDDSAFSQELCFQVFLLFEAPPLFVRIYEQADFSFYSRGGSRGGTRGVRPPLFLDQTQVRRAEKNSYKTQPPPYLRIWMTVPPRNLKVWIRYCIESGNSLGKTQFLAYSLLTALFLPTLCLAANGKPVKPEGPVSY